MINRLFSACTLLVLSSAVNLASADENFPVLKGEYLGQQPPGRKAERFAPGIVSTGQKEGSIAFFDDGNAFLFTRMKKGEDEKNRWNRSIFLVRKKNDIWLKPELTKFSELRYFGDFTTAPDGQTLLVTASKPSDVLLPEGQEGGLGVVKYQRGKLSDIEFFKPPLNMPWDGYPSMTASGKIYFMSEDRGGFGNMDLFAAEQANGAYLAPVNLGVPINSIHRELDPLIAPDESFLIFSVSRKTGGKFVTSNLYICFKNDDASWSEPIDMGPEINSADYENRPYITPDGKYFFFNSGRHPVEEISASGSDTPGDVYWVSTDIIKELKAKHAGGN